MYIDSRDTAHTYGEKATGKKFVDVVKNIQNLYFKSSS